MATHLAKIPGNRGKPAPRIPGRAQRVVELSVLGINNRGPMDAAEIAAHLRIKEETVRRYLRMPAVASAHRELAESIRRAEYPKNTQAAVSIRDDKEMAESAAGNRARLEAMRFLENIDNRPSQTNFNVGPGGMVMINPGYIVDVSIGGSRDEMRESLKRAGSTASVFDDDELMELNPTQENDNADTER